MGLGLGFWDVGLGLGLLGHWFGTGLVGYRFGIGFGDTGFGIWFLGYSIGFGSIFFGSRLILCTFYQKYMDRPYLDFLPKVCRLYGPYMDLQEKNKSSISKSKMLTNIMQF